MNARDFFAALPIPIVQSPMLGASTPEMTLAVGRAGGLGSFAAAGLAPDAVEPAIQALRQASAAPFAVNLLVTSGARPSGQVVQAALERLEPWYAELGETPPDPPNDFAPDFEGQFAALVRAAPPLASFAFDNIGAARIDALHAAGTLVIGTATTVAEARTWAGAGADAISAQGAEAGGHRGHFLAETEASLVGTMALVPAVIAATGLPTLAAGGIMDGRGVAAALSLGAAAAQMGTAFLLSDESPIGAPWRGAIATAADDPTRLTRALTGRHARGIETRFMREMRAVEHEVPAYPVQNQLTQPMRAAAAKVENAELMSLWAGQGVRLAGPGGAEALVRRWWDEARAVSQALAARTGPRPG